MYRPHGEQLIYWLLPLILLWMMLGVIAAVWRYWKRSNLKSTPFVIPVVISIFLIGGVMAYDNYRLRKELRSIPPDKISQLNLSRGKLRQEITNSADASELMFRLQSLRSIAAHHSGPTNSFEISFLHEGRLYEYVIGRDSARPDEYWVAAVDRKDDIGRIRSRDLEQLVQRLLSGPPSASAAW